MDFKIEVLEFWEVQIFEIYWLCKTHPRFNTASIKAKIISLFNVKTGPRARFFSFSNMTNFELSRYVEPL